MLASRLDVLGPGERTADGRQRTLQAALAWSFELLGNQEQLLLMRLAPLRGSFDLEAAESLAAEGEIVRGDVLPLLTELVDKSLVTIVPSDQPLYRLLATMRLFAHEQSAAHGELAGASRRHRDRYLSIAEDVARHMLGSQLAAWLPIARAQHDDLLAALTWSLEIEDGEAALQLASALAYYWFRISQLADGRRLLGRALRLAPTTSSWRARGLVLDAWLACAAGAADAAGGARSAVGACADRGDELEGLAWLALAAALLTPAAPSAAALDESEQALSHAQLFAQLGEGEGDATAEAQRGLLARHRGELELAFEHLVRARQMFRTLRGTLDAGWTLVQLAEVALALGDHAIARSAGTDAVGDFRARGDARGVAASFAVLGRVYRALGDDQRAERLLTEGLRLARSHGYTPEAEALEHALEGRGAV
jgi:tetratricopeptide (TPR) repeat protein